MKNDAQFFFCFAGFIGFLLFYLTASVLHNNFAFTLIHGAVGCLCFAVYGRFLLGILLNGSIILAPNSSLNKNSTISKPNPQEASKRKIQPRQIPANEKLESNDLSQSMVDEKV